MRRVDFETELDYRGQEKRVRLHFPLNLFTDNVTVGSQFAAEKRIVMPHGSRPQTDGSGVLFHALDWVDCAGPDLGLCFSAIGLHEYEFTDGVLSATLLRSVNYLSRGKDDDVIETETAREVGTHSFRYSLIPHKGKWDDAKVWKASAEHRLSLMAYVQENANGNLPLEASFLEIQGMDLALSCLKPTENAVSSC
jgi:alpha-mannosidase